MKDTTATWATRQALEFDTDKGAARSTWIAAAILIAILGWMGSGFILPSDDTAVAQSEAPAPAPVTVAVVASTAAPITLYFHAEGQTQPDLDTAIRAGASGEITEVFVSRGDEVARGQIIARLATAQAEADLYRATEELGHARREFDNARTLMSRGVATEDRVAQARAALAGADARVTAAGEDLARNDIIAPIGGRIESLTLTEGEFISAGSGVGRIVDNTPLSVSFQVPQQALNMIETGQTAEVSFITGEVREGRVTFVGTAAFAETRTFLAEVEVPNQDGAIPAGISAEIKVPTATERAHFIAPSAVSLNPEGVTGVKTVEGDRVAFHQIEVVRAEVDGLWVSGLPAEAAIITIGQGFVREGETVDARPAAFQTAAAMPGKGAGE